MQNRPQLGIAGKNQAFAVTLEKCDKVGTEIDFFYVPGMHTMLHMHIQSLSWQIIHLLSLGCCFEKNMSS